MKGKAEFGSWEGITLLVNIIFVQAILYFPKETVAIGGSAGWMIPIGITLITLIYFAVIAGLYRNIGGMDLLDISEKSGGRVLKIIAGLLAVAFLIFSEVFSLGNYTTTLKAVSLDKSPFLYISALFLLGMIASAYYGIEIIARINAFIVPAVIVGFILITIGVIPEFNTDNLFPVFGEGIDSILRGSTFSLSVFSPILLLFFMVPFFKLKYLGRIGYYSIVISGLLLFWSTLSYILTFPYDMALDKKIPVFQMARLIKFGNYIQRVESVFVLVFSLSAILYMGVLFAFSAHILAKTLNLVRPQPIVLPLAVIVYSLAFLSKRYDIENMNKDIINIVWLTGLALPLIILIIGSVKNVGSKREGGRAHD